MNPTTNPQAIPDTRPRVLVIGPGPAQVGGVATFIRILLGSPLVNERYVLIHHDTSREAEDTVSTGRFLLINVLYWLRQLGRLVQLCAVHRPQIVHLPLNSGWATWKSISFLLVGKLSGAKVIAHLHSGNYDRYYRRQKPAVRKVIGSMLSKSDCLITMSESWRRFLLEEVHPGICAAVIPNPIDPLFAGQMEENNFPGRREGKTILFVGRLGQQKGVFDILAAAPAVVKSHPEACYVFAGQEDRAGDKALLDRTCAEQNLGSNVHFSGVVTGLEKLALYRGADVFLLPSHTENLPFALLEAMASSLPVIATPVGLIPELIRDGVNGFLIEPGDCAALAKRTVELLEAPNLRASMGQANQDYIRSNCLPEAVFAKLDSLYSSLLSRTVREP